jgi:hypothetical protein
MHRDHAARLDRFPCPAVWGCQRAGEYAIKGRLIHATQPWFVFRAHAVSYSGLISVQDVRFDRWDHGFAGGAVQQLRLSVRSNF